jgi:hypothetical protein
LFQSKLPTADNLPKIHLLRGDVELLRFQLGIQGYEPAIKGGSVLVSNAEKFYRGSRTLAREVDTLVLEAGIKEALAIAMAGDSHKLREENSSAARGILEEAIEDSIVTMEQLSQMGIS